MSYVFRYQLAEHIRIQERRLSGGIAVENIQHDIDWRKGLLKAATSREAKAGLRADIAELEARKIRVTHHRGVSAREAECLQGIVTHGQAMLKLMAQSEFYEARPKKNGKK